MNRLQTKTLIKAGILFALIVLLTWLLRIPLGITRNGQNAGVFLHAGDIAVYIAAVLLGGPVGAAVSAAGSALGYLIAGSGIYAIPALIFRALMVFVLLFFLKKDKTWLGIIRAVAYAGGVMVAGFFLYDLIILGSYEVAALSLPFNLIQMIGSGLISLPILKVILDRAEHKSDLEQGTEPPKKTSRVK